MFHHFLRNNRRVGTSLRGDKSNEPGDGSKEEEEEDDRPDETPPGLMRFPSLVSQRHNNSGRVQK